MPANVPFDQPNDHGDDDFNWLFRSGKCVLVAVCRQMEGHLKHIMACVSNFEFPPPGGDVKKIEPGEIFPFEWLGDIFLTCAQLEVTKQVVLHYQAEDKQSPFQHLG